MKKIIEIFGLIFLSIVVILNLVFTANIDAGEHITIKYNSFIYIIGIVFTAALIYFITKTANNHLYKYVEDKRKKKIRKILLIIAIAIFIIFNIIWVITVRPAIIADQIHACNIAQTFYRNNLEEFLPDLTYAGIPLRDYMQAYHQQISLAFVFSLFFRIIHFDGIGILRSLNVIANIFIIIALYKIVKQLSEKYKTNKVLLFTLILTFISLPMLSTFIYGDIPSLALCLFAVYYMMKYTKEKKIRYAIIASILTMIAYMMRMNSLIFIIATTIYLVLNLLKGITKKGYKENLVNIFVIIIYIIIAILPSNIVKNYYLDKYEMDKTKEYPNISYILMAMEESWRGNGWYSEDIGEPALKNGEEKKVEYVERIKQRLQYFSQNMDYTFEFYTMKLASMWSENTYSAIRSNLTKEDDPLEKTNDALIFYQKALLILTCVCCLLVLIQNRKNLSLELLFLITIFIGGFAFHILWEAKSRYIIPYIIVLIPVASISINKIGIKEKISKILIKLKNIRELNITHKINNK